MRPMLDNIELPHVQEIATADRRVLVERKPPGMPGSLLQNLGRKPGRIVLWGVATGPDALEFVGKLDEKFRAGAPVPFTADIVRDAEIDEVVIDDLKLQELAGRPERFAYVLALREFIRPTEPEDVSLVDADALADATGLVDALVDGLDLGAGFATGLERFVAPLGDLLTRLRQFNEDMGRAGGA